MHISKCTGVHFLLLHNSKFLSIYFLEKGAKLTVLLERMAEEKKKKKKRRFTLIVHMTK